MNNQTNRFWGFSAIPQIFFPAAGLVLLFIVLALSFQDSLAGFFGELGRFTFYYFGWFYVLVVSTLLIFLLWLAFSGYGALKLGHDNEKPAYSTTSWFAMLFAAGIGTILMFWGVAEPLSHYVNPPLLGVEPESLDAARNAMNIALYHFGLHTWTIFVMPALAIAYFSYRHNLPLRISSVFYPLLGDRIYGPAGWAIDVIALTGTVFGVSVSVGLGALQLNSGLSAVFDFQPSRLIQLTIVAVVTLVACMSIAMGLDRGIKRLSEINILLALLVMIFVWIVGPTLFITSGIVQNFGNYMQNLPWMSFWTEAYQGTSWQQSWTVFYWAWTISWAPYVGIFIARISRGRTIKQFVLGALGAPMLFTLIWFSVFGITAIDMELNKGIDLKTQVQSDVAVALFDFLFNLPLPMLSASLSLLVILIFLITSVDSAAMVVDHLSRKEGQESQMWQRQFWTLLIGITAATMLSGGGLPVLQNVVTALGFPFCILLLLMAISLFRALGRDQRAQLIAT
ncbi:MAG: BCCT family transporter [Pseudohongiella sp.]|nr:BCCT family transporter [Pseudohongiella sp.]MDP2126663.1 BCCT family transporter [Pseudohongiella sp.]